MGIKETLQDAFVKANNERHNWHEAVQGHDSVILGLKTQLQRARTQKAGVEMLHTTATSKYNELREHIGKLSDESAKSALRPDMEDSLQEANMMVRNLARAGEAERDCQREISEAEMKRTSAAATERWEQIKKQIEDLNRLFYFLACFFFDSRRSINGAISFFSLPMSAFRSSSRSFSSASRVFSVMTTLEL